MLPGNLYLALQAFVILAFFFSFVLNSAQVVAVNPSISKENLNSLSSLHTEPPVGAKLGVSVGGFKSVGNSVGDSASLGTFEGDAEGQLPHVNTQMSLNFVLPMLPGYLYRALQAFVILAFFFSCVVNSAQVVAVNPSISSKNVKSLSSLHTRISEGKSEGEREGMVLRIKLGRELGNDDGRELRKELGDDDDRELGNDDGKELGNDDGRELGNDDGRELGNDDGKELGSDDGRELGKDDGRELGNDDGRELGNNDGRELGKKLGNGDGRELGKSDGRELGNDDGRELGMLVGFLLFEGVSLGKEDGINVLVGDTVVVGN